MNGATSVPSIRICQPGFDVHNCPDWAYLFNSDWPNLAIGFEQAVPKPGSLPYTINHNLGFPPLVMGWNKFGSLSYGRVSNAAFRVDHTSITFLQFNADVITVRAFNVDISQEASYSLPQSASAKLPYNTEFGIKMAKQARLITSSNLNDFIIHSRAQSPAVLTVATEKGKYFTNVNPGSQYTGPWVVYPLKTSYLPWMLSAKTVSPGTYQFTSINGMQIINNQIVFPMAGASNGSLIVLRDPLFYPNTVRVVY